MGPWDRNHGFFHMSKARKPSHVTLIMRNWLPLGENPFGLEPPRQGSHVEQAKKVSCWTHDAQSTASRADCACSAPKQTTDKLCVSPPKRKVGREEQLETQFVTPTFRHSAGLITRVFQSVGTPGHSQSVLRRSSSS